MSAITACKLMNASTDINHDFLHVEKFAHSNIVNVLQELESTYAMINSQLEKKKSLSAARISLDALYLMARNSESADQFARRVQTNGGLLASIAKEILAVDLLNPNEKVLPLLFDVIETPLQKMTRKGLGLLTQGLGRWTLENFLTLDELLILWMGRFGFGSSTSVVGNDAVPHPTERENIVICVIGGISFNELAQVRRILEEYHAHSTKTHRIWILSNKIINTEELLTQLFLKCK